jgi:steroid delta-isomerase-like uncharacterized protein
MSAQSTKLSPQQLIAAAKAPIIAYNDKKWDAVKASITPDFVYDEVATNRKVQGLDQVLSLWQGWAAAFPDSKATIDNVHVSGDNKAVLEITWRGTHQGALLTPKGSIPATGKRIEFRSCVVCEVAGEKAKSQRQYFDMATMLQQIGVGG